MNTVNPAPSRLVRLSGDQRSLESASLGLAVIAFVVVALVAVPVLSLQAVPISGRGSIGEYAAISSAVVAALSYLAGVYVRSPRKSMKFLDILDTVALALAHAVIALLSWTVLAVILEHAFIDAEVFAFPALVLGGAAAALTAYASFFSATHMDLSLLAVILAVFLVQGVLASTLTTSDPHWWQENLSALGIPDGISSLAFNLTLIIAGVIVAGLARSATRSLPTRTARGRAWVRGLLITVGIFLSLVGVFPVSEFLIIHNTVATGMAVAFGVLVIGLPRWVPGIPRAFVILGWLFLAVVAYLAILFAVGYYTLTAVELIAGVLIFSWIVLFVRSASALEGDLDAQRDADERISEPVG